jgi:hypothetical protein
MDASENETHLFPRSEMEPGILGHPARSTVSISVPVGQSAVYFRTYGGLALCSEQTDLDLYRRHQS